MILSATFSDGHDNTEQQQNGEADHVPCNTQMAADADKLRNISRYASVSTAVKTSDTTPFILCFIFISDASGETTLKCLHNPQETKVTCFRFAAVCVYI